MRTATEARNVPHEGTRTRRHCCWTGAATPNNTFNRRENIRGWRMYLGIRASAETGAATRESLRDRPGEHTSPATLAAAPVLLAHVVVTVAKNKWFHHPYASMNTPNGCSIEHTVNKYALDAS